MEKNIQVTKVEVLGEGTSEKGNPWVRRKIYCNGDNEMKWFITFDDEFANSEGQQMRGNFSYSEKYKSWQTQSESQEKKQNEHEEIMGALRELYGLIAEVNRATVPQNEKTNISVETQKVESETHPDEAGNPFNKE